MAASTRSLLCLLDVRARQVFRSRETILAFADFAADLNGEELSISELVEVMS